MVTWALLGKILLGLLLLVGLALGVLWVMAEMMDPKGGGLI